jgi:hypothetical protein
MRPYYYPLLMPHCMGNDEKVLYGPTSRHHQTNIILNLDHQNSKPEGVKSFSTIQNALDTAIKHLAKGV